MVEFVTTMQVVLGPSHHKSRTKHKISDSLGVRDFPDFVRLEIAQFPGDEGYYLNHICEDGSVADTWHNTIQDAFHQAEWEFGVRPDEWQAVKQANRR